MQTIDVILGAVLAFFIFRGVSRGFWRQLLGLAGWLGGLILAFWFSTPLTNYLQYRFESIPPVLAPLLAFTLIFLFVYFFTRVTANALTRMSEKMYLDWLNRLLGGVIGALKGGIVLSLILWGISLLPLKEPIQQMRQQSKLYAPIESVIPHVFGLSTRFSWDTTHFKEQFQQFYQKGKRKLQEEALKQLLNGNADTTSIR